MSIFARKKLIFKDEIHFCFNGFGNHQNYRIWVSENTHAIQEEPVHPQRFTVWCSLWTGRLARTFLKTRLATLLLSMMYTIGIC